MARGCRAIVKLDRKEGTLQTAGRLFHEWVHKKYLSEDSQSRIECDAEGIYRFGELTSQKGNTTDIVATKLTETSEDKYYERQLLELVERTSDGHQQWTMRIFAMHVTKEPHYRDMVWTEATPPRDSEWDAKPPRLVHGLISEGYCYNRGMPLPKSFQFISGDRQVEELIGWIRDERRRASAAVVVPPTDGNGEGDLAAECRWKEILGSLTWGSAGYASYFLLTLDAYRELRAGIGQGYDMSKGNLCTYLPGLNPGEPVDGLRHRVLTVPTLLRSYDEKRKRFRLGLSAVIARTPCGYLWGNELNKELRRVQAPLDKKRLTVPMFYPLREVTRMVELLDKGIHQRVAKSLSAFSRETGLPAEESSKPGLVKPEDAAPGAPISEANGRTMVTEPALPCSESWHLVWYESLRRLIRRFLSSSNPCSRIELESGITALSSGLDAVNEAHSELTTRCDKLRDQLATTEDRFDETVRDSEEKSELLLQKGGLESELREAQVEREFLSKRNCFLEQKLKNPDTEDNERDFAKEQLDNIPQSMSELFDRMTEGGHGSVTRYVVLSEPDAMIDDILKFDALDSGRYAVELWNYILALRDYMRVREAGDFSGGGVHDYLVNPPGGYCTCSVSRHKLNESETMKGNEKMRRERIRPVPAEADPRGEIEMWAHLASIHCDQSALRMYYYPDTTKINKIYIGYIGRHLTNTKTN